MNKMLDVHGVMTDADWALVDDVKDALKPNAIADPGTVEGDKKGPGYILAKAEWAAIQVYARNALVLPTTGDEFRSSVDAPSDYDLSDFEKLIGAYFKIHEHVVFWQDEAFPSSVALASRVYQYGSQKVPVFYPAITTLADQLAQKPDDKALKAKLIAAIESIQATAQEFADESSAVAASIAKFSADSSTDNSTLVGPNGDAGLVKYYDDKYGKASKEVQDLIEQITDAAKLVKIYMEEYHKDVTIAATTPTYAWIFPFGTIAGAVVAGVYGDKAVKALDKAQAAQAKVDELNAELKRDADLMNYIHLASGSMNTIVTQLAAALPAIQKLQGVWAAMASDLGRIVTIIDQDIKKAPPIIMSLGVDEASRAWASVSAAADNYRKTAYIDVQNSPEGGSPALEMQHRILGPRFASSRA